MHNKQNKINKEISKLDVLEKYFLRYQIYIFIATYVVLMIYPFLTPLFYRNVLRVIPLDKRHTPFYVFTVTVSISALFIFFCYLIGFNFYLFFQVLKKNISISGSNFLAVQCAPCFLDFYLFIRL